jgi:hypothetical protein
MNSTEVSSLAAHNKLQSMLLILLENEIESCEEFIFRLCMK